MAQSIIRQVSVSSIPELDQAITSFLAQGYIIANRTPTSVTLQKAKQFSILWTVVGFLLCILPLLIYLIVYASQPDYQIIEIRVADPQTFAGPQTY
jgi:hypothetical protein